VFRHEAVNHHVLCDKTACCQPVVYFRIGAADTFIDDGFSGRLYILTAGDKA